ncbi:Serine/threonine-protein kinase [Rhynchospora pubera]|uniref:Receptor-like serine/threonine-protein kinase n=1 Tax=Rhynchospora pubera TaxID=906938 RepID=A0AAV8G5R2_9POAL|nr:Serine/threonine-protein kinase [Rhynchospora pubera]
MANKIPFKQLAYNFLLFAILPISFSIDTLNRTTNISEGPILQSTGGKFELALVNFTTSEEWFLGIRFMVSPETVVWIANREHPLNHSSGTLVISKSGLDLIDPLKNMIWSTNSSSSEVSNPIVQLLDSGNLIIKEQNKDDIIWQSFDYPSDTLLPGMKVGKNFITGHEWTLSSWESSTDPSIGRYYYKMDTQGVPEIKLMDRTNINFRTGAWDGLKFSGMPELGLAYYQNLFNFIFVWSANEVYYSYEAKVAGSLSRVVLNATTGNLQRKVWDQDQQTWNEVWYQPKDTCDDYKKCGPYGICNANNVMCSCLDGFDQKSPEEWQMRNFSEGCQRKTTLSCNSDDNGFYLVKGVKVPESHNATVYASIGIENCRNKCLANCSCMAYSLLNIRGDGSDCITWSDDLVDIRLIDAGQDLYIKMAKSDLLLSAVLSLLIGVLLIFILRRRKKRDSNSDNRTRYNDVEGGSFVDKDLPTFDLTTLIAATDNFSDVNRLGHGGFGVVYKGKLPCGDEIAVKRLSKNSAQGLKEFMNEVKLIVKLQHRNLVRLLGCCIHDSERMLIYEFMPNKSLDYFIFDKERRKLLDWRTRLEVVIGIARGILYLHQDSRVNIIHRDLKAANILLDGEMTPKISDFGIARLFKKDQNEMGTITVVGTRGYMSPEYAMEGKISVKSDVYSFGVLLLEIVTGKRNHGDQNLLAYVWKSWQEGDAIHLVDDSIDSSNLMSELMRCVHVGLLCVQECADDRPMMSAVVSMLTSEIASLPQPKKPVLSTKTATEWETSESHESSSTNPLTVTAIEVGGSSF